MPARRTPTASPMQIVSVNHDVRQAAPWVMPAMTRTGVAVRQLTGGNSRLDGTYLPLAFGAAGLTNPLLRFLSSLRRRHEFSRQ